ncbi:MAG: GTPase domain-containing protein [Nitrospirae bacterium]|jgi:mutual gliding-motility protein MglA|nr:GTPase domain-containing protein [Nitrospirota bacterium]
MALFNYATKEITIKIVYYGPGLSGKTTNLQYLHSKLNPNSRGKLLSLATEADRTLFFDFLPVELGKINDFSIRFQLYTVPGQVRYNATRKLVLKGADAVVFVADSQREMSDQNIDSLKNMQENLLENNIDPDNIPVLFQYNKRDLPNILSIDELNRDLNENGKYEFRESVAINGIGVDDSFRHIIKLVINGIARKHNISFKANREFAEALEENIPETVEVNEPATEEPVPAFETSRYETSETIPATYEIPDMNKDPEKPVMEEAYKHKEVVVKEVREVPVIPSDKLELMINGLNEISQTLKEIKNLFSDIHSEVKESKKEQKEMNVMLREIRNNFQNIRRKKSWFRF